MSVLDLHARANPQLGDDVSDENETGPSARPAPARVLTVLIRGYQAARSGRPTGCRYLPTCSEYAIEAVDIHGPARGILMATRRIGRCGPWGGHGIDPVPERSNP